MITIPEAELVAVDKLKLDGENPNRMTDRQIETLTTSIEKYGFIVPIITNKDLLVADGEQRLTVATKLKMRHVPVIRLPVEDVDRRLLRQVLNKLRGEHELIADAYEFERIISAGHEDELKHLLDLSDAQLERYLVEIHEPKPIPPPKPLEEIKTDIQHGDRFRLGDSELICGDCVKALKKIAPDYVDFVMFSPPYWGLRDYGIEGQIGLEAHPSEWIKKMVLVCGEIRRVLKKSGSMYLNIGDTYYATVGSKKERKTSWKRPSRTAERKVERKLQYNNKWLQPKQLLQMPARLSIALQDEGWILRNDIIWHKPNPMPSSVKDRLNNTYEHIYHFVRSKTYFYDLDAIREPHKRGTYQSERDYERMMGPRLEYNGKISEGLGRKSFVSGDPLGKNPGDTFQTRKYTQGNNPHRMRLKPNEHLALNSEHPMDLSHPKGKNPGDFWNIPTSPFPGAHFAVYPEAICEQPILSSCPAQVCKKCGKPTTRITKLGKIASTGGIRKGRESLGRHNYENPKMIARQHKTVGWSVCNCNAGFQAGIVLDPMCGAGTTALVAHKLGRRFIVVDLNPKYCQMTIDRWESYTGQKAEKLN